MDIFFVHYDIEDETVPMPPAVWDSAELVNSEKGTDDYPNS